ncbi:MAG: ATPase, T2SS/T4P/T4SS family [bacterium]
MTRSLDHVRSLSPKLTPGFLEEQRLLPLSIENGVVHLGSWGEPVDCDGVHQLESLFNRRAVIQTIDENDARHAITRLYGGSSTQSFVDAMADHSAPEPGEQPAIDDLRALANEAPVIRFVSLLLSEALEARASDVHLEAYADGLRIRTRIDGVLQDAPSPARGLSAAIVSRLKVMANLDIAERRVPQDGRIRLELQNRHVDVRVSTVPTLHGESVVLRLLDRDAAPLDLTSLGMSDQTRGEFEAILIRPHGIVLATGPTGSGKTTTLYAALSKIRTGREKIVTVEDPIEYQLAGIPQVSVNERVGVTFASTLRALLRQDPDVILVGEIRDGETAEIATQAALTGHLVLSTLHTNDAIGALTRLVDLGVAPFLVSATIEAILAQRLVRTNCSACSSPVSATDAERVALGASELTTVHRGSGCVACRHTGYLGRTGVYELLVIRDAMRTAIASASGAGVVRQLAREQGMRTLRDDSLRLVREGRTTPEEVLRLIASS